MIKFLKTTYLDNKVLILSFFVSILCYVAYIIFRGFGWDGDSFISASQYQKLIGSDLYGIIDGGAHPKIFTVLLFGIIYQLSGGFYILTIISILLNTLMITTIISWVRKEKGVWLIALVGILINIPWTKIVVNCDNPAFSLPFIIFGLFYISKDKIIEGTIYLVISSLFRSGSEFILVIIFIKQLFNLNIKNVIIIGFAIVLTAIHTYWGYLLIYPTKELFWELAWEFITTPANIAKYQYSYHAFIPYIVSIVNQLFYKYSILFIIPAILGGIKSVKNRSAIRYILLLPVASFLLPISSFIYGTEHTILETKHMGYTLLLPVLAAFSINNNMLNKFSAKSKNVFTIVILSLVIFFSAITGHIKHGDYETNVNGTGKIGWINLPMIKQDVKNTFSSNKINILTAYNYLTFALLDVGQYAYNIDIVRKVNELDFSTINQYNLIIIPKTWKIDLKIMSDLGYMKKSNNNNSCIYFILSDTVEYN